VVTDPNTWPACIGEHAAALANPRNWAAACAATQARQGCDIGTHGRALLDNINAARGRIGAECAVGGETHNDGADYSLGSQKLNTI